MFVTAGNLFLVVLLAVIQAVSRAVRGILGSQAVTLIACAEDRSYVALDHGHVLPLVTVEGLGCFHAD